MATVNVSNFLTKSFDWQTMVDQLIEVSSRPKVTLEKEQVKNTEKIAALTEIKTAMQELQDSVQALRETAVFSARTVSSDTANTTWKANSTAGAALGTHRIAVSRLATVAKLQGNTDIGAGLSGGTLATLNTAATITAGFFSINGKHVAVSTTDSLEQVFTAINTATAGAVTAAYNAASDRIELTSSGPLMIGAANDTSNFLGAMRLTNDISYDGGTGTYSTASSGTLGTVKLNSPLASAGLRTAVPGTGSFSLNGVNIDYDGATDSLATVLARINASDAGVTAAYDAVNDRVTFANNKTGDFGITLDGDTGGLLDALGLTGAAFAAGQDAQFTINGGPVLTSPSNTLDPTAHGITGLSVTVNSETTQTLEVVTDGATAFTAIQNFIEKFNAVQSLIDTSTKITSSAGKVTTSILSDNREVDKWADQLRALAFGTISGLTGSVKRLDDLGIDFDGITGQLTIKDTDKLSTTLLERPDDVEAFFLSGDTGLVSKVYSFLTTAKKADLDAQTRLSKDNLKIDTQIADIQRRLDAEREKLTNSFLAMQSAQSKAQSQNTYLTNTFFKNTSSS